MTPLRQRMREDMQLRGFAPRTQDIYIHAVQQFAVFYQKSPEQISDEEVQRYFVYLRLCCRRVGRYKEQSRSGERIGYAMHSVRERADPQGRTDMAWRTTLALQ